MRPLKEIKKAIGCAEIKSKPQVDEAILQHLRAELARATTGQSASIRPRGGRVALKSPAAKAFAAAAIVILALFTVSRPPHLTTPSAPAIRTQSAADLLTVGCLNVAYRRGGMEALDRQCEEAACQLDAPPEKVSIQALVEELKGT